MERRRLGKNGAEVSVIGLGTYRVFNTKGDAGVARCEAVVDAALESGANVFDSSPMYGESESVLAETLRDRRDQAFVATKVWARSRAIGEGQIDKALDMFGHIDLYQVHNLLAADDHLPYLRHLRDAGRVGAVGATHYLPSAYPQLLALMRTGAVDAIQIPYHPMERTAEAEVLPEAERLGIGVIVMMPLAAGSLLTSRPSEADLARFVGFDVYTWPQVLLKWILSHPAVTTVIPATSSPDHMRENAGAGSPPWFAGDQRMLVRRIANT
jgi:aryl-alcohol dehydrogenase-like predicted oxidoreductase